MVDVFFSKTPAEGRVLRELLNGDWTIQGVLQHYCWGPGCCDSELHTCQKLEEYLLKTLAKAAPPVFPRHKWVGADTAIDWFGKYVAIHGLLRHVFDSMWGSIGEGEDRTDLVPFEMPDLPESVEESDFKLISKRWKQCAVRWCRRPFQELLLFRLAIRPNCNAMARQLSLSSAAWDRCQVAAELETKHRKYRMSEAFKDSSSTQVLQEVQGLLVEDFADRVPLQMCEVETRCLAFRLWARSGAATYFYLRRRHKQYPYKLFGLLLADADAEESRSSLAEEILGDFRSRPCIMDEFTEFHLRAHAADLLGDKSMLELRAVATMTATDIAATECAHAANRRAIEGRSMHTHRLPQSDASAMYVARCFRQTAATGVGFHAFRDGPPRFQPARHKRLNQRGPARKKKIHSRSRYSKAHSAGKHLRRGGGTWAVFLSERNVPVFQSEEGKAALKRLSREYKQLKAQTGYC